MDQKTSPKQGNEFSKKIWLASGIVLLTVVVSLLFKTLFNLLLLVFAGVLMCVYFHGFAGILKKKLKIKSPYAIIISVALNVIMISLFFWFVGARLSSQIDQLSNTLPQTIDHAKMWLSERPLGNKILNYATNSVDSGKASATIQSFFSSTFGILSDFYIVVLLGLFFT
ncbi:MAG: AI-2E family transporter, partial [Chryseobacterium sp.]|nr:AI-2E family transporter [Chryseobacterium sp.]